MSTGPARTVTVGLHLALLASLCLAAALAPTGSRAEPGSGPAAAQGGEVHLAYLDVIEALDRDGYLIQSVTQTMLRRVRILAKNEYHLREVIVSRASGEILRDAVIEKYRDMPRTPPIMAPPSGS